MKELDILYYKKMKRYFLKNIFFQFSTEFSKNYVLAYYFCVIGGKKIFCISGERDWCPLQEN